MSAISQVYSSVRAVSNESPEHDSVSKKRTKKLISLSREKASIDEYTYCDVDGHVPQFISQVWIGAVSKPESDSTSQQHQWRK